MSLNHGHTYTRRAAEYIADICVAACEARLQMPICESFTVNVEFDSIDITIRDDTSNLRIVCDAEGAQIPIEEMQDVEIDIEVKASSSNISLEVDSYTLVADDPDIMRNAIIKITSYVPTDFKDTKSLREEIVASIVHELRHAIQFIIWNIDRDPLEDEDINPENHLMSPSEIDARVEEICSYSDAALHVLSIGEFEALAKKYLWGYIKRNFPFDVDLETAMAAHKKSLKLHVAYFKIRRDCYEFTNPTG